MQLIEAGEIKPSGEAHSLAMVRGDWLAPLWLGVPALNGIYSDGVTARTVPDYEAPPELATLFDEAVELLFHHHLLHHMAGQDSDDLVELTGTGKKVRVWSDYELDVPRRAEDIIRRLGPSVFHIVTVDDKGDQEGGTAFIAVNQRLVTCAHCIHEGRFTLYVDGLEMDERHFTVSRHRVRDLAVLTPKSPELRKILKSRRWFGMEDRTDSISRGESVVSFGYPYIARLRPQMTPETGTFKTHVTAYEGCDYLTLTNSSSGGCSGGPVVNNRELLVGVMTSLASKENDTSGKNAPIASTGLATPSRYLTQLLGSQPPDSPLPFKVCPTCESHDLAWGEDYAFDQDEDGAWSRTILDVVVCGTCGWQSEPQLPQGTAGT
jgi:hypothetical protein